MAGKLKSFDEHFNSGTQDKSRDRDNAALLGALFAMHNRGIPMKIERLH